MRVAKFLLSCPARSRSLFSYAGRRTGSTHDGWPVSFERIGSVDPSSVMSKTSEEFRIQFNVYRMEEIEEEYISHFIIVFVFVTDSDS